MLVTVPPGARVGSTISVELPANLLYPAAAAEASAGERERGRVLDAKLSATAATRAAAVVHGSDHTRKIKAEADKAEAIRRAFEVFDKDGSGNLSVDEVGRQEWTASCSMPCHRHYTARHDTI